MNKENCALKLVDEITSISVHARSLVTTYTQQTFIFGQTFLFTAVNISVECSAICARTLCTNICKEPT